MTDSGPLTETRMSAAARKRVLIGGLVMFMVLMASPYVSFIIGENLRGHYHYAEAIRFYDYACWRGIVGADPYLPKAMCEYNVGDYRNAIMDASRCIMRNPKNAVAYAERAFAYIRLNQADESDIFKARKLDRQVALYYHRNAYRSIQDNADPTITLEFANKATCLQPGLGKAYINRCTANTDLGNYEEAIEDTNLAREAGLPDNAACAINYNNRARAELHLKLWDDAQADAKEGMKLDKTNESGYLYYGCALIANGKYKEALAFCDKYESEHPGLENVRKKASVAKPSESEVAAKELLFQLESSDRQFKQVSTVAGDVLSVIIFFGIPGALGAFLISRQRRKREGELRDLTNSLKKQTSRPGPPEPPAQLELLEPDPAPDGEHLDLSEQAEKIGEGDALHSTKLS